jgi:hypothetical protein
MYRVRQANFLFYMNILYELYVNSFIVLLILHVYIICGVT